MSLPSGKEIGAELNLSPFTVKNNLARAFEKLQVRCRAEAVPAYITARSGEKH